MRAGEPFEFLFRRNPDQSFSFFVLLSIGLWNIYFSLRSIQIFISVQRTIKIAFMLSNHSLFMACCVWVFCAHLINGIDHIFFYLNYFFSLQLFTSCLICFRSFAHSKHSRDRVFFSCAVVGFPINYNKQISMHGQWTPTGYLSTHLHIYASSA